jgi:hypothetical protein
MPTRISDAPYDLAVAGGTVLLPEGPQRVNIGMQVRGWPVVTISRGEVVCADGQVFSTAGRGRFLRCARPFAPKRSLIPALVRHS